MRAIILLASCALLGVAGWTKQLQNCAVLNAASPYIYMEWTPQSSTSTVDFGVYASGSLLGYAAVSLYATGTDPTDFHADTPDLWIGISSNGTYCSAGCVEDAWVSGTGTCMGTALSKDTTQNLVNATMLSSTGGVIQFEFSRALNTGDSSDVVLDITSGATQKLVWAVRAKSQSNGSYSYHSAYGWTNVTLGDSRWDSDCPAKPCFFSALPTGASGWGTCSSTVASGTTCSLTCSSGYVASSGTCSAGSWSTSAPACAASTFGSNLVWTRYLDNCATITTSPQINLLWTAHDSTIDVGVIGSGSLYGYVAISVYPPATAVSTFHTGNPDLWMGISSNGTFCSSGCVQDAAINGTGSCMGTSFGPDASQDLTSSKIIASSSGNIAFEFTRNFNTGDTYDSVISTSTWQAISWAVRAKSQSTGSYGFHSGFGWSNVSFGESRWDSGCPTKQCNLSLPSSASGWGTCSASVVSGATCSFSCSSGYSATAGTCSSGSWVSAPSCTSSTSVPTPSLANCVVVVSSPLFRLYWQINGSNMEFETYSSDITSYVAFGIASSGTEFHGSSADSFTVFAPGSFCTNGCVSDDTSTKGCMTADATQNTGGATVVYDSSSKVLYSRFSRSITASDSADVSFTTSGSSTVFWAYSNTASTGSDDFPYHDDRGSTTIDWSSSTNQCGASTVSSTTTTTSGDTDDCNGALPSGSYTISNGIFRIDWRLLPDRENMVFTMIGKTLGWISFGLNSNTLMKNADKYTGWVDDNNGTVYLVDTYCTGRVIPRLDSEFGGVDTDPKNVTGYQNSTHTVISFYRALDTGDQYDKKIVYGQVYLLWAYYKGDGTSLTFYEIHGATDGSDYGSFIVNLMSCNSEVTETSKKTVGILKNAAQAIALSTAAMIAVLAVLRASRRKRTPAYVKNGDVMMGAVGKDAHRPQENRNTWPEMPRRPGCGCAGMHRLEGVCMHRVRGEWPVWSFIVAGLFIVINAVWVFVWLAIRESGADIIDVFARLFGHLTSVAMLVSIVPATRNSLLTLILGESFERTLIFHRWVGRWTFIALILHTLLFVKSMGKAVIYDGTKIVKLQAYGLGGLACCAIIFFTSFEVIRRKAFTFFFFSHFSFIPFFVLAGMHNKAFLPFLWASIIVWGVDRIARFIWGTLPRKIIEAKLLPGDVMRVRWSRSPFALRGNAGQYVFANFPQVQFFEWHPFTFCSGPREQEQEVNIKLLGTHTKQMLEVLPGLNPGWIRADGPYGHLMLNLPAYKEIVLLGLGVGVAPMISIVRDIYGISRDESGNAISGKLLPSFGAAVRVTFHWGISSAEQYTWFHDIIAAAEDVAKNSARSSIPLFRYGIHVSKGSIEGIPNADSGRMDVVQILETAIRGCPDHTIAVLVCGPAAVVETAWDEVARYKRAGHKIDFHYESFLF